MQGHRDKMTNSCSKFFALRYCFDFNCLFLRAKSSLMNKSCLIKLGPNELHFHQNHGLVWGGRDLTGNLVPTPLLWAETPFIRSGCSKPHPSCPKTLPGMGSLPRPLNNSSGQPIPVLTTLSVKNFFLMLSLNLPSLH